MTKSQGFLLLMVLLVAASCSRRVTSLPPAAEPKAKLNIENIDFDYFQGKARMVLRDGDKEREVKANVRIRKDSVIWMTFSVIGVQGGKALIDRDSITIVSTVDKEYYVFPYTELSERFQFEINYEIVQAAMLGNPIVPRSDNDDVERESSMFLLKQNKSDIDIVNYVNAASMKIEKVEMKQDGTPNSLVINYSNFQPVGDKIFPYNGTINLFYKTVSGLLNTTIIFEYSKAEVGDKELRFPFNIPKKYVRR
jgi:hypothetical protein